MFDLISLVEEFYLENRRLPESLESSKNGIAIGLFLDDIQMRKIEIKNEQLKRLNNLGFIMLSKTEFSKERKIRMIEQFYEEKGRLPKQNEYSKEGEAIGMFLSNIKLGRSTKISCDQLKRLEKLGFNIKTKDLEKEKERKIQLIEEFYKENGRLPKQRENAKDGTAIGTFLNSIKMGSAKITEEQLKRLEKIGFSMEIINREYEKERKIRLIEQFYKENGRLPKYIEKAPDGTKIGIFLSGIKNGVTQITKAQWERLERIGVVIHLKPSRSDFINLLKRERDRLIEPKEKSSILIKKIV